MSLIQWRPKWLILSSGLVMATVGTMLLRFGLLSFLLSYNENPVDTKISLPLMQSLYSITPSWEIAGLILMTLSLFIGYFKGKMVISKSVRRNINRIQLLSEPTLFIRMFPLAFYPTVALMATMGSLLRTYGSIDVVALVYTAIGCALIKGALVSINAAKSA